MLKAKQIKTLSDEQLLVMKKDYNRELKYLFKDLWFDYNGICTSNLIMVYKNMETVNCISKLLNNTKMTYYVICSNSKNKVDFEENKYKLFTENEIKKYVKCDIEGVILNNHDITELKVKDYAQNYDAYIKYTNEIKEYIVNKHSNIFILNPIKLHQTGHTQGNHDKIEKLLLFNQN